MNETRWAYFKLYPGSEWDRTESLLLAAWASLSCRDDICGLFFLRFSDSDGLHLRLRFRPADAASGASAEAILARLVAELPNLTKDDYRPAIPSQSQSRDARPVRLVADVYRPETEKFGERGIHHAERLFHDSSRLACSVLLDERAERYARKTIVPPLMYETARALGVAADDRRFWQDYADFWSAGQPARIALFRRKAAQLAAAGEAPLTDEALAPTAFRSHLTDWCAALADAGARFGECERPLAMGLPAHMIHLTNNRLGIAAVEEAYYATLLAEARS